MTSAQVCATSAVGPFAVPQENSKTDAVAEDIVSYLLNTRGYDFAERASTKEGLTHIIFGYRIRKCSVYRSLPSVVTWHSPSVGLGGRSSRERGSGSRSMKRRRKEVEDDCTFHITIPVSSSFKLTSSWLCRALSSLRSKYPSRLERLRCHQESMPFAAGCSNHQSQDNAHVCKTVSMCSCHGCRKFDNFVLMNRSSHLSSMTWGETSCFMSSTTTYDLSEWMDRCFLRTAEFAMVKRSLEVNGFLSKTPPERQPPAAGLKCAAQMWSRSQGRPANPPYSAGP
eukprot:753965-Hanusia_phi.AAC.8